MGLLGRVHAGRLCAVRTLRQMGLYRGAGRCWGPALLLTPPFFAHGHFNNKDIALFFAFAVRLVAVAGAGARRPGFARGACFALCGALAANTEGGGACAVGVVRVVCVLVRLLMERRVTPRVWGVAGVTVLSFAALHALLTPALWADPAAFFSVTSSPERSGLSALERVCAVSRQRVRYHIAAFALVLPALYMMLATTPLWIFYACARQAPRWRCGPVCAACAHGAPGPWSR